MKLKYDKPNHRPYTLGQEIKIEIRKSVDLYLAPSRAIVAAFKNAVVDRDLHEAFGKKRKIGAVRSPLRAKPKSSIK